MLVFTSVLLASSFFAQAFAGPSASTMKACAQIAAAIPHQVSSKLSIPYRSEVDSYWSTALRDVKPACLVLPRSAAEVATAVRVLNKYPSVEFAVKSGGHDPNPRHSSVKDGVLISTKDLAGVIYDPDTQLAYVKPGGEWNDVISSLDEQGVAIVGGRLGETGIFSFLLTFGLTQFVLSGLVGVGGYLLQGGISFLSTQYGLAADVSFSPD
jgi:FAD/FMN-containing dehydrogenase